MLTTSSDADYTIQLMLCILFYQVIGAILSVAGVIAERALPATMTRRWLWVTVIALSFVLPLVSRFQHTIGLGSNATDRHAHSAMAGHLESTVPLPGALAMTLHAPQSLISPLWLATTAMLTLWAIAATWRVARKLRHAEPLAAGMGDDGTLTVVPSGKAIVTDAVGPATVGLLNPRIAIPRWVLGLPSQHRHYVVHHEEEHRRARDPMLIAAASIPLLVLPWCLPFWWQLRRLRLAIEVDCDARVVAALGDAQAYGRMLVDVAAAGHMTQSIQPALLGGLGSLERRLLVLLAPPGSLTTLTRIVLLATAVAIALLAGFLPHPVWSAS